MVRDDAPQAKMVICDSRGMVLGFLNLYKPAGWTSHDCVARVRRLLRSRRVGHGGTLDPAAVGVLPVAIGKATRLLPYLPTPKQYHATIRLGQQTTTDDLEGETIATTAASNITRAQIEALIPQFIGTITQIPPAYSAIQRDGKRLYALARAGEVVDVPERQVHIMGIRILQWQAGAQAEVQVEIDCGPGTYIRAIARDWGQQLGVGGTLAHLVRTRSCGMTIAQSIPLETLEAQADAILRHPADAKALLPPGAILQHLPGVILDVIAAQHWCQGQVVTGRPPTTASETPFCRVQTDNGQFLGIGTWTAAGECRPKVVIGELTSG